MPFRDKLGLEHSRIPNRINDLVAIEVNRYVEQIGFMLDGPYFVSLHFLITQ